MNKNQLSEKIRNLADSIGIDAIGFANAEEFPGYALNSSPRRNPKLSLPDARSIIVAGIYIGGLSLPEWTNPWYGRTSRLYLSGFFTDVVKPLEPVVKLLKDLGYQAITCESTSMEKSIIPLKLAAIRAGLGWQGKHSLLISKKYGTFMALGGIITNADLEHNTEPESDRCKKCNECQQACPLEALDKPYVLDRDKCLSNLLQEEELPGSAQSVMENRIIDCEICQQACPWNKKHLENPLTTNMTELFQEKIESWKKFFYLPDLINLSEKKYREKTAHLNTGIPYKLFHRNVLIALENGKKAGLNF